MSKKATIQYRHLKTDGLWDGVQLQQMLADVLNRKAQGQALAENAKLRILDLDQDKSFVILNKLSDQATWGGPFFAGQLIHLAAGADVQAVLQSLEEDTNEFLLQNVHLGDDARVLKGALYFAAAGNHVGLIEGQQVKGRTLERYLTSLFQKADELEPGQAIILNSLFLAADGKELSESTELTIAAGKNRGGEDAPDPGRLIEREAAAEREKGATVFDILRFLGWVPEAIESLRKEVPDDGYIEGYFKVFIKERNRKKPISRATINEALRNIDPADMGLRGDGTEKGGIVKLSIQRSVESEGGLLDPRDSMEQIVNALRGWAASGKIDCNFDG